MIIFSPLTLHLFGELLLSRRDPRHARSAEPDGKTECCKPGEAQHPLRVRVDIQYNPEAAPPDEDGKCRETEDYEFYDTRPASDNDIHAGQHTQEQVIQEDKNQDRPKKEEQPWV